jgi:hypothetical protein
MTRTRLLSSFVVLSLGLSVATACGSGTKTLTAEAFAAQGNAICSKGSEDIGALFADGKDPSTLDEAAQQKRFDEVMAITKRQIEDIAKLKAPNDIKAKAKAATDALAAKLQTVIEAGAAALWSSPGDPFAEFNDQLKEIGLTGCVSES